MKGKRIERGRGGEGVWRGRDGRDLVCTREERKWKRGGGGGGGGSGGGRGRRMDSVRTSINMYMYLYMY